MHNRHLLNASHASGDDFAKVKLLQTLNPDVLAALKENPLPQQRHRPRVQFFVNRCDAVVVVQHQALHEFVSYGGLQLAQAAQVWHTHGGRCLDFNADDASALILNDQVHLVLLFGSEVRDAQPLIQPIEIKKSDNSCKPSLSAPHRGRA